MKSIESNYIGLLKRKISLIENIIKNTRHQGSAIADEDTDILEELLEKRQKNIDIIDKIDKAIGQLRAEIGINSEALELEKLIQEKFKQLCDIDSINIEKAEILRQKVQDDIFGMNMGKKALSQGYLKSGIQSYGYFVDKKIGS